MAAAEEKKRISNRYDLGSESVKCDHGSSSRREKRAITMKGRFAEVVTVTIVRQKRGWLVYRREDEKKPTITPASPVRWQREG